MTSTPASPQGVVYLCFEAFELCDGLSLHHVVDVVHHRRADPSVLPLLPPPSDVVVQHEEDGLPVLPILLQLHEVLHLTPQLHQLRQPQRRQQRHRVRQLHVQHEAVLLGGGGGVLSLHAVELGFLDALLFLLAYPLVESDVFDEEVDGLLPPFSHADARLHLRLLTVELLLLLLPPRDRLRRPLTVHLLPPRVHLNLLLLPLHPPLLHLLNLSRQLPLLPLPLLRTDGGDTPTPLQLPLDLLLPHKTTASAGSR